MTRTTGRGSQQKLGRTGPPGPRGERGRTGPRGQVGKTGARGMTGHPQPIDRATLLDQVNGHIEDIYRELAVQLKRMSQIQLQVDELREKLKKLAT